MVLKSTYTLEELLLDETFFNFYCQKNENDILDWEDWCEDDTERTALVTQAYEILDRLSLKWDKVTVEERYQKIREELLQPKAEPVVRKILPVYWRYAAAASLLLVVATWFLFEKSNKPSSETAPQYQPFKIPKTKP
jgi:transmembrane sensor